jgi:hypothetical protein
MPRVDLPWFRISSEAAGNYNSIEDAGLYVQLDNARDSNQILHFPPRSGVKIRIRVVRPRITWKPEKGEQCPPLTKIPVILTIAHSSQLRFSK